MDPDQRPQDHLQKPPPPYEEVQKDASFVAETTLSKSEAHMNQSFSHHPNHLSIENPMAEVFSNPEFDHVELKIQGQINPSSVANSNHGSFSSSARSSNGVQKLFQISNGSMLKTCKEKSRQVFFQWKDWHRPEVIGIRLALILLALILMVQLVRVVKPSFINQQLLSTATKQELKSNSGGRTGKALINLLDTSTDQHQLTSDSEHVDVKLFKIKMNQADQDIEQEPNHQQQLDPLVHEKTTNTIHQLSTLTMDDSVGRFIENEHSEQDILEHHKQKNPQQKMLDSKEGQNLTTKDEQNIKSTSPLHLATTDAITINTTTEKPTSALVDQKTRSSTTLVPVTKSIKTKILDTISTTTATTILPTNMNSDKNYSISIIIHSANVPDMDSGYLMGRASDTYCNVFIDDQLVGKTPIIDNSNNPSWHYLLPRQFSVKKDTWIRIELMDSDHVKNDHIGGILLNFGDLLKNNSLNKPINMFHGRGYIWVTISSAQNP